MQVHSGRLVLLAMLAENGLSPLLRKCLVSGESSPQAAAHGEANVRVMVIAGHGHRGSWLSRVMGRVLSPEASPVMPLGLPKPPDRVSLHASWLMRQFVYGEFSPGLSSRFCADLNGRRLKRGCTVGVLLAKS